MRPLSPCGALPLHIVPCFPLMPLPPSVACYMEGHSAASCRTAPPPHALESAGTPPAPRTGKPEPPHHHGCTTDAGFRPSSSAVFRQLRARRQPGVPGHAASPRAQPEARRDTRPALLLHLGARWLRQEPPGRRTDRQPVPEPDGGGRRGPVQQGPAAHALSSLQCPDRSAQPRPGGLRQPAPRPAEAAAGAGESPELGHGVLAAAAG